MSSNLPSLQSFRPYSSCQYSRNNGVKGEKAKIIPHPPVRQRPVSANPTCGSFQTSKKPTIAGNWTNGFLNCDNAGAKALDSVLDLDMRLHETEDKLNNLVNSENESYKKDFVIESLREEIEYLRGRSNSTDPTSTSTNFTTGCHQKIAALHNQVQLTTEDNDHLRVSNDTLRLENDNLRNENETIRLENDTIRTENDTGICSENRNLLDENERFQITCNEVNHQVSELNVLLSQRDHELCRVNKEKCQTTMMVTTLQKEVTAKDEQLRKSRADVTRHKTDLENKKNELSTLASRLAKNLDYKQTLRDLKRKEEDVSNLQYELKSLEDKILLQDDQIMKLHQEVKEANKNMSESENIYKCQIKSYQDKLRGKEASIKNINIQLAATKLALEESKEREREKCSNEIEATESISGVLCKIEKRLVKNGRSCKSLNDEIETLRGFDASNHLRWVKECFLSSLCQELNWEREIEDALKAVTGDSERASTPPTLLIQILHEKLGNNLKEMDCLEKQINSEELKHAKDIEDVKNKTKEKYKQKAEKAVREMKDESKKKYDQEIQRLRQDEEERLTETLKAQREEIRKEVSNLEKVKEEVVALQNERNNMKIEFELLRNDIEQRRISESEYKERLEQSEKQRILIETITKSKLNEEMDSKNEMLEKMKCMEEQCSALKENNDLKRCELNEVKTSYKGKINDQSDSITSLEYQVISLKHDKTTMERRVEILDELIKDYKEKEHLLKQEEEKVTKLSAEVKELISEKKTLKSNVEEARMKCKKEEETSEEINEQLHSALANLSDLKGDLSDKEKQKIEHLEEKSSKQEKELVEQQIHLVKLSTLVDEQKIKLIEQNKHIHEQQEMLADRHIPWARKEMKFHDESIDARTEVQQIGERCISGRHDEVIKEQRNAMEDMKKSFSSVPVVATLQTHTKQQHLAEMSHAIHDLKDELAVQEHHSAVTDQQLYTEVCRLEQQLIAISGELSSEQASHQNNLHALEQGEEAYLTFVHSINKQLDIEEILGAKPLSFSLEDEREKILTDRAKGLEVIVNRIKSIKSRIERKDQLLESYDDDFKKHRETENYAERKQYEVDNLQAELSESRNELSYLQEALKKWRAECDDLKRQIVSLKQKKVLSMDYKGDASSPSSKLYKQKKSRQKQFILDYSGEETA